MALLKDINGNNSLSIHFDSFKVAESENALVGEFL